MTQSIYSHINALLGKGASFEGTLVFEGVVRIDGNFKGNIFSRDTLIIGEEAKVYGHIDADIIVIAGYVEGEIRATSKVEIQATGYVRGSLLTPSLVHNDGCLDDCRIQMTQQGVNVPS